MVTIAAETWNVDQTTIQSPPYLAGDTLLLFSGCYNAAFTTPGGWTARFSSSGSGTYVEYGALWSWTPTSDGPSGSLINRQGQPSYSANIVLVLRPTDFGGASAAGAGQTGGFAFPVPALTATLGGRRLLFATQMSNGGGVPIFTPPAGYSLIRSAPTNIGTYHRSSLWMSDATVDAGSLPSLGVTTNETGGMVGGSTVWASFGGRTHQMML
jgi:hypothetical protein